jgi:hypothetical protein
MKTAVPDVPTQNETQAAARPKGERTENPLYCRWSKFTPGTTVVFKETTENNSIKTLASTQYRLTNLSEEKAVVEMEGTVISPDGTRTTDPSTELVHVHWFELPPGVTKDKYWKPAGIFAEGDETLNLAGKSIATHWYKYKGRVEAGETNGQLWISEDVPGGVVKSTLTIVPTKKVVRGELAEWKTP